MPVRLQAYLQHWNQTHFQAEAWIFWERNSGQQFKLLTAAGFGNQDLSSVQAQWQGHQALLEQVLSRQQSGRATAQMTPQDQSSQRLQIVAFPLLLAGQAGVLEFFFADPLRAEQAQTQGVPENFKTELAEHWLSPSQNATVASQQVPETAPGKSQREFSTDALAALPQILSEIPAAERLAAVLNHFCLTYQLKRVSLLQGVPAQPELLGISGVQMFEARSAELAALLRLAREISPLPDQTLQQLSTPVDSAVYWLPAVGDLAEETGKPSRQAGLLLEAAAPISSPEQNRIQADWPLWQLAFQAARNENTKLRSNTGWTKTAVFSGLVALVLLFPIPLTIQAPGYYWPVERSHLFAPEAGLIQSEHLQLPADREVQQDQLLLTITSRELELEISQTEGQLATLAEQIRSLRSTRTERREEPGGRSTVDRDVSIQLAELTARHTGLEQELQQLQERHHALNLKAPLSGKILTWDAEAQLSDRPVSRGQLLLTIGQTTGSWEVLAEVRDRDLGWFKQGIKTTNQVGIHPETLELSRSSGAVRQIAPALSEKQPGLYTAKVSILADNSTPSPQPGARVFIKVSAGKYPAIYVWFRHLIEMTQRNLTW